MNRNYQTPYPDDDGGAADWSQTQHYQYQQHPGDEIPLRQPAHNTAYAQNQNQHQPSSYAQDDRRASDFEIAHPNDPIIKEEKWLDRKWRRRLFWIVPLLIFAIVLVVLFEVYKSDFERWVQPLANWLRLRKTWSWALPVAILILLSFPPLFGHELVQIVVGLTYPLGVAIGIVCAGAVLGEAACFIAFKYAFSSYVDRQIATKIKWAAMARVVQQAGFRGVLVIRYSIVPPHLANPLFACTGMKFWLYIVSVILSLPKSIVFVILGAPSNADSKGAKYGKVVAVAILVVETLFATRWIRKRMKVATEAIEAERAGE